MLFGHSFGSYSPVVRSLLRILWHDLSRRSFRRRSSALLPISNILTSYHHTRHVIMLHCRRNHSHGFISTLTIIALLAHRHRHLTSRTSDASHAQFLGIMYSFYHFGFRLHLYRMSHGMRKTWGPFRFCHESGRMMKHSWVVPISGTTCIDERAGCAPMHK